MIISIIRYGNIYSSIRNKFKNIPTENILKYFIDKTKPVISSGLSLLEGSITTTK